MSGPQAFVIQNDTAIVWDSYGLDGGFSVERWYPGWELRVSPWDHVWVWNNAKFYIDGGFAVERWYPGWEIRCSPWDNVFVWNNAGTEVLAAERWYPDWTITCSPWDAVWVWNNAGVSSTVVGEETPPTPPRPGDEERHRRTIHAVKPTGLGPYPKRVPEGRKSVDERLAQSLEIQAEVAAEISRQARTGEGIFSDLPPIAEMSLEEINSEIGILLRKKLRTEEEDIVLLLLMMAALA